MFYTLTPNDNTIKPYPVCEHCKGILSGHLADAVTFQPAPFADRCSLGYPNEKEHGTTR